MSSSSKSSKRSNIQNHLIKDNNFFVSKERINKIIEKQEEQQRSLTDQEQELLLQFEERKLICENEGIHYWVTANSDTSLGTYCYFCNVLLWQWTQKERWI